MRAPDATSTRSPVTTAMPPLAPRVVPVASRVPDTRTVPASPPDSTISPSRCSTVCACTMPLMSTTRSTMPLAAAADRRTRPPSAKIRPSFFTSASAGLPFLSLGRVVTGASVARLMRWSP